MNHDRTEKYAYFDTPDGQAQLNAFSRKLRKRLKSTDPLSAANAWADYRQAHVNVGLVGLTGSGAVYHLCDAASGVYHAALGLTGGDPFTKPSKRIEDALSTLSKAWGYRYQPGVDALRSALAEFTTPPILHDFDLRRELFAREFIPQLDAAGRVNRYSANPAAVADTIGMLALELSELCDWLNRTPQKAQALSVRPLVREALALLNATR